jgi:PucR family transcriptional regulator, purine catabolism regulatory protein
MEKKDLSSPIFLSSLLEGISSLKIQWISGKEAARTIPVPWISVDPSSAQNGDLLLLENGVDFDPQTKSAVEKKVASIGIVGNGYVTQTPLPQIPIFRILPPASSAENTNMSLRDLQRILLSALLAQRSVLLEAGLQIQTRLTQIAALGEGLTGLVAAMREMIQHSILVQDKRLTPLASSPNPSLRPIWDDLLEQLEEFSTLPEVLRDRRQAGETPLLLTESLPGGLERVIVPIVVGDVARGYLSSIALSGELDRTDRLVVEQGALVCAVEMARAKAVRETEKRLHGDLLSALLHQTLSARDANLWALNMGLNLDQQHAALRLAWEGQPHSLRRLETLVNGEVSRAKMRVIVSSMSGEVICFCEISRSDGKPSAVITLAQRVIDASGQEFPDAVIRCGIGVPAADLGSWSLSFRQAGQALDMARRLDERKPLYYMDLSVYRLLLQFEDSPDLISFLQETLGAILSHENSAEFLETLEEYFTHNGNLSQTAEALFIHRNTLTYRMNRITAITKLDFENPDTRLAVQLALCIKRMSNVK